MPHLALLGGTKVRTKDIAPQQDFDQEERRLVMEVLDSKVLSGFLASPGEKFMGGEKVKALEGLFKEYYHVKHALTVNSATAGLHAQPSPCRRRY